MKPDYTKECEDCIRLFNLTDVDKKMRGDMTKYLVGMMNKAYLDGACGNMKDVIEARDEH